MWRRINLKRGSKLETLEYLSFVRGWFAKRTKSVSSFESSKTIASSFESCSSSKLTYVSPVDERFEFFNFFPPKLTSHFGNFSECCRVLEISYISFRLCRKRKIHLTILHLESRRTKGCKGNHLNFNLR